MRIHTASILALSALSLQPENVIVMGTNRQFVFNNWKGDGVGKMIVFNEKVLYATGPYR